MRRKGGRGGEGERETYGVAADGGDDGFADVGDLGPVLEELILVHVRDCLIRTRPGRDGVGLRTPRPMRGKRGRTLFILHLLDVRSRWTCPSIPKQRAHDHLLSSDTQSEDKNVPANALSDPVSTIAPTSPSSSNPANASFNSSNRGEHNAFSALGRLSVMSATRGSGFEVKIYSYCFGLGGVEDMRRRVLVLRWVRRARVDMLDVDARKERARRADMGWDGGAGGGRGFVGTRVRATCWFLCSGWLTGVAGGGNPSLRPGLLRMHVRVART